MVLCWMRRVVPISGVIVNLVVNDVAYNVTTDVSGKWSITYLVSSNGVINVVADFVGNSNYTGAVNTTYFNGAALNSTLIINHVVDTKVNSSVSINGSLLDEKGVPISNVKVVVTVKGVIYNVTTDVSGKWSITYLVGSTGLFNVVAIFNGNTNHAAAGNETSFNGVSLNSTLIINHVVDAKVNSSVSINGSLLDEKGVPISNVKVVVTVNGVVYSATTDVSGKWSIIYLVGSTGRINVVAEFVGNVNYVAAVNSTSFNGLPLNSTLIINHVVDAKVNSSVSINGSLLGEKGVPVSNVKVVVTVNGVVYSVTTDVSGKWSISYFVGSTGRINVVAEFVGNVNYVAAVNSTSFNGLPLNSTLIINHVVDAKVNSSVSINGSLLGEKGVPISNVKVVVTVSGVNYNATTDASGKWSITYLVGSTGLFNVLAVFDGNDKYVSATNSTTFIVTNNVNISIVKIASINGISNSAKGHVGDIVIYTINVVNNGVIDATGVLVTEIIDSTKLKFNKASVTQGSYNNINGLWTIDGLAAGETVTLTINATIIAIGNISNSANVSASGNNTNSNNSSSVTIVSVAIPTQINTLNVIVAVDNSVKLESILKDSNGKSIDDKEVKFYVNGKLIGTAVTDVKGVVYFKYTPTKTGTLTYTSSFTDPIGFYDYSTSTSTITVTKDNITLTTKLPSGYVGDKKTIKIKATSESKTVPNKTFTVYINGKKIGNYKTNNKGEFTIKTTLKSLNKLQIKFAGDNKYNKLSKTYTYIAKSKEKTITIIYYAKTKYSKPVNLKAKLTTIKGKVLAGKYIKFYVAGKYVGKSKTNKKGIAILKYTPKKR
ncbi:bacterial Ig-like domain protein [Methanobrevibacter filiformis]|uniref:Bacterial Ig-like domain protein n=2 Tax=Methanobrevibacter filiformis TaxID=55758 RepID=A0A166AJV6_9EURY|nr:bacterial Ig-like domain protein [Methanobrevibacter filiformis]